jgi:choline dehydrogenase
MKTLASVSVMLLWLATTAQAQDEDYDFIIVGGGTAGCVMANRLCQALPDARIALFEAGGMRTPEQERSVRAPRLWGSDPTLQDFWFSEPNPALGFPSQLFSGRTLGGSSALYTSLFIEPEDLSVVEDWGIDGLTAATARTYLDKVRAQLDFAVAKPPDSSLPEYAAAWLAAVGNAGIPVAEATVTGGLTDQQHYTAPIQTQEGVRIDASSAYIYPIFAAQACIRLSVKSGVTVSKINIDETTKTATGVTYFLSEDTGMLNPFVNTARNVILSAGPYHSPKLLQLSGIGPTDVLTTAGINVIEDLPVGQNTISRPISTVIGGYGNPLEPANNLTVIQSEEASLQFEAGNGGVLGTNIVSVSGTIAGGVSEISFAPPINPLLINQPVVLLVCSTPTAVGSVRINGTNPFTLPIVELNYLDDLAQLDQLVACTETYHSIFNASLTTSVPLFPIAPEAGVNFTDYYLTNANGVGNSFDIVAGSAVGAVLDGSFNVMGVNSLKVIDASALPSQTEGTRPLALVYMIAEMAAVSIIDAYVPAPTYSPSSSPTAPTYAPTNAPTSIPTYAPSSAPSAGNTITPSAGNAITPGSSVGVMFVSAVLAWSLAFML